MNRFFQAAGPGARAGILWLALQAAGAAAQPAAGGGPVPEDFEIRAVAAGYMNEEAFLEFLARAEGPAPEEDAAARGTAATLVLILLGGLALNLTPCVLPMIPVNLAIIGAGAAAASRRRGFFLGAVYGSGMAFAYGALGLAAALTGARLFGALAASPGFNLGIALFFGAMALAMFDVLSIDLSRFQPAPGRGPRRAGWGFVFGLGGLSALLAGACVAPVVITVLLLAGAQVADGQWAGLLWPFWLGLGMALPWPFAGAGLARLPKAGAWMKRVKAAFGVFILLLAAYYGRLAWTAWSGGGARAGAADFHLGGPADTADWPEVWARARAENKPVFVDFWATWCKNCEVMERTTFRRPAVVERFRGFVVVKVQSERMEGEALDRFGVQGLPTYALVVPK